ncbi:hypothetical protein BD560DRAFT_394213 [Blakeslea trispora]|nr:hypothetical protein BD560DRAFT_394213 [Blakeslea trispora]
MSTVTKFYAKVFGIGAVLGVGMEVMLVKSNYYQMLAASEAKQRMKELQQEQEDSERFNRIKSQNQDKEV